MNLFAKKGDTISIYSWASLALVFSKDFIIFSHAQDGLPSLQRNGRLSAEDLDPYQTCTQDSDCVSFNNGLCDCANGGKEISINSEFTTVLQGIFDSAPPRPCTKIASQIPCGIGGGNVCRNEKCHFRPCADKNKASQCSMNIDWEAFYDGKDDTSDTMLDLEECMLDACKIELDDSEDLDDADKTAPFDTPNMTPRPTPSPTPPTQGLTIPTTLIRNGKFTTKEMKQYQECENDSDCVYVQNGFCDCANGGEEQAIHASKEDEFNSIFQSRPFRCTKIARELPCGVGAGVICNARNLCEFQPCRNKDALDSCDLFSEKVDPFVCLEDACAEDNSVDDTSTSSSDEDSAPASRPGILGGFLGNIFITRDPEKQRRPGNLR